MLLIPFHQASLCADSCLYIFSLSVKINLLIKTTKRIRENIIISMNEQKKFFKCKTAWNAEE